MKSTLLIIGLFTGICLFAQESIPFDSIGWELGENSFIETYKGYQCLNANSTNTLKDFTFKNGIIDYDVLIQPGRGFPGIRFRNDGEGNMELFYIRTHQSGNPDAMQYTPVPNGISGWQLYFDEGYSTAKQYHYDEWFHVRLVIAGDIGEVFIEDMERPILILHKLGLGEREGGIGFGGPARYANLKVEKTDNPDFKGKFKEFENAGTEVIKQYRVSETFSFQEVLENNTYPKFLSKSNYQNLSTENGGLANLSRVRPLSREKNAVAAEFTIQSNKNQIKRLDFGFSDNVMVYLNEKPIFYGSDVYMSRDYRFLGTMGYFDTVFLNLKKGKNKVTFIVGENFGGWGVKARFQDLENISVSE